MTDEISILLPVYRRNEFLHLFLMNVKSQTYDHNKLTLCIDECESDTPFIPNIDYVKQVLHPIKVDHRVYNSRSGIGEKRNRLVKNAKTKYVQFMDSDDFYFPDAIQYNYNLLKSNNVKCVGSDKMLFTYMDDNCRMAGINCADQIHLIHEATLFFDRKWFHTTNKFTRRNCGEGKRLFEGINPKYVSISDVKNIMICICHKNNTVNKDRFKVETNEQYLSEDIKEHLQKFCPFLFKSI
tara:strand:+ start:1332 stop:2048 length:717 start_codon:yes stop_codon:yes gene_type:complete